MKNFKKQIILIIILMASTSTFGQYFSSMSNLFDMDTKASNPSVWCIMEGDYLMPGQEVYLDYYIYENNFVSLELGISYGENGEIEILQNLPFPGPAYITIPEVAHTQFARMYLICKDSYGHIGISNMPSDGYFNIGPHIMTLDLPTGWSGISNPYIPVDPSINNILSSVVDDVVIMQDIENVYWPGGNVFTLTDWEIFKGYLIKTENPITVQLEGTSMNQCIWYSFTFPAGWGLFSVAGNCDLDAQAFFEWNLYSSEIIKEAAGWRVLWPEYGINTIEILERGKSYFIKSDWENEDWSFQPCWGEEKQHKVSTPEMPPNWNNPIVTPNSHIVAIPQNVIEDGKLKEGSIIGAFSQNGLCVGVAPIEANHISVFGDDNSTEAIDGMIEGETVYYKIMYPGNQNEMELIPEYDPLVGQSNGTFLPDGMSVMQSLKIQALGIDEYFANRISILPNPANSSVKIEISTDGIFQLKILDTKGSVVYNSKISGQISLNTRDYTPGLYFVKINNDELVSIKKLMIE